MRSCRLRPPGRLKESAAWTRRSTRCSLGLSVDRCSASYKHGPGRLLEACAEATGALKPTWKSAPVRRVPGRLGYFLYRAHIWLVVDWSARAVRGKTLRYALPWASSAPRSSTSSSLPSAGSCVCCGLPSAILTSFLSSAVSLFPGNRTSRPDRRPKPRLTARVRAVSICYG